MSNLSINDFENVCRTCLLNCDIKFPQDDVIKNIFYKLTDIQFQTNEELPQQICSKCFEIISDIQEFASRCKQTHFRLLKCLYNFKNTLVKKEPEVSEINLIEDEEIAIDQHDDVFKEEVLNSPREIVADELKIPENNELIENINTETSEKQNINYFVNDFFSQETIPNPEVKIEVQPIENVNINDEAQETNEPNICYTAYPDSPVKVKKRIRRCKNEQYKCDSCGKTFFYLRSFKKHKSMPSCGPCLVCEKCSKSFKHPHELENHKCTPKKETAASNIFYDLNGHLRTHTGERLYKCGICFKLFSRRYNLNIHMRTHSNERPYKCSQCPKSFRQFSNLSSHLRIHSNERPFKCNVCSEAFRQPQSLNRHLYTHSIERPYECTQCMKTFRHPANLTRHLRTHGGEY